MKYPPLFGSLVGTFVLVACGGDASPGIPAASESGTNTAGELPGPDGSGSAATAADGGGESVDAGSVTPRKDVRFIAVGDTGTGTNDQKKVGNAMAAVCKARGCDFVQLLGDNVYESGVDGIDDPLWQETFEIPYVAVEADFFAVLGNHDYGHLGAGTDFGRGKHQIAYTAKSTKWKMPAAFYRHSLPGLEIFALDTNMQMFGRDAQQRIDVSAWIAGSTAPWKIAVGHHPYKSNGSHGNAGRYDGLFIRPYDGEGVKEFLDEVVCGQVDVYLSGHDHSRQWLNESCKGTELAVSGAGAKATSLEGTNPALFQSLELGFLYIVVEGRKLVAEFIDDSGNVEFSHTITK
jgi:hypothetical protein